MKNNLPQGWMETSLEDLLDSLESGSRPKGGVRGISEGIPSIGGEHLNYDGGFDFTNIKYVPKQFASQMNKGQIKQEDILIVKDGATTGKTSYVNEKFPFSNAVVNEHVFICRLSKEINSKYLFWYLWSDEGNKRILENFKGSAQGGINKTFAPNTAIPLAPLPEQQRIIEKLDALMARISNSKTRLEKIPTLLKNFRQSVLAAAVSGELTKEWRNQNENDSKKLFESIQSQRIKKYEDACKIAKTKKERKPSKPSNLDDKLMIEDEVELLTPRIPDEWIKVPLAMTSANSPNSIVDGPFGSSINVKTDYIESGVPVIRINNVRPLKFINENLKFISQEKFSELERHNVSSRDILLAKVGATIGDCCIYPEGLPIAMLSTTGSCRITVDDSCFDNKYVCFVLNSLKNVMQQIASEVAQPFLNMSTVKNLPIPFCPIEEQKEIVRKIEELFHFADSIEARYQKAKAWFDKLPQAILAKAFRGELVPQNDNDEPAEVLLNKIKNQKAAGEEKKKERKKNTNRIKKEKNKTSKIFHVMNLVDIIKNSFQEKLFTFEELQKVLSHKSKMEYVETKKQFFALLRNDKFKKKDTKLTSELDDSGTIKYKLIQL